MSGLELRQSIIFYFRKGICTTLWPVKLDFELHYRNVIVSPYDNSMRLSIHHLDERSQRPAVPAARYWAEIFTFLRLPTTFIFHWFVCGVCGTRRLHGNWIAKANIMEFLAVNCECAHAWHERWEEDLLRRNPYSCVTLLSHNIVLASKQKHQGTITQLLRKCVVS